MPAAAASTLAFHDAPRSCGAAAKAEAEQRLRESPYFAHRTLRCDYHEGVLTVRGRVPSYYLRQMALETVRRVKSVEQLVDRIEVE
jgi:hypothetical protein